MTSPFKSLISIALLLLIVWIVFDIRNRPRPVPAVSLLRVPELSAVPTASNSPHENEVETPAVILPPPASDMPENYLTAYQKQIEAGLKKKRFSLEYGAIGETPEGPVRSAGAKVGVNYHVSDRQTLGVETRQQFYDRQDAKAWGKSAEDEQAAEVKYKVSF